ncbi:MAG TPA: AAA family ATPase, partial [Chloroflexota bacterium]|nr:AAA family ATPase [Chloroflexota bacterium]
RVHQSESRRRERLAANIAGGQRRHRCQVIAFHGAKGGVGTTLVAANVAVALRRLTGERVALVDASLQNGDIGVLLNLTINSGIDDLLPRLNDLDIDLMNRVMGSHESGVRALLAPRDLERAEAVGSDEFRRVLSFLVGQFDYVIIDTAPVLDAAGLGALDHADQIVLVATPEVPSLKNSGRFLQLARRLGYPSEKIALVVNQANGRNSIPLAQIEQKLGIKIFATVPSAASTAVRAANHGEVLGGGIGGNITQLARKLAVQTSLKQSKKGILGLPKLGLPSRKGNSKNGADGVKAPRADAHA